MRRSLLALLLLLPVASVSAADAALTDPESILTALRSGDKDQALAALSAMVTTSSSTHRSPASPSTSPSPWPPTANRYGILRLSHREFACHSEYSEEIPYFV